MSDRKIKWGILSTAKIGTVKVIPGLQKSDLCEVIAISSRAAGKAQAAAEKLGLRKAYDSYDALLRDPEIEAIYNPLPNHLHVPWTKKAIEAGKHVLCEKPVALDADEAKSLLNVLHKNSEVKVMEAFMYRFHPQWIKAKELVKSGEIGEVKTLQSFFSYFNDDPRNIRNMPDIGGGGLMDIGCYCISFGRFIFDAEPHRVVGLMEYDPGLRVDRLASGILDFTGGKSSTFTCSTQLMPFQRCVIFGTDGYIEIEIPVNAPPDQPTRLWLVTKSGRKEIEFEICDQYTAQGTAFAKAIIEDSEVPTPLIDAVNNMRVIDAVVESARANEWIVI
ncbi:MAG: Gfo/Idh/MocA family oxidoreductase [Saprospiraceae bacterium]|nr:Gfo/Idh/MocA family oxidoreductase [Saprospiraceae bacterium]